MAQHTHVVDLGAEHQIALLTLMTATVDYQDLVNAIAEDRCDEFQAKLDDLVDRMANLLVLPADLTHDVLRGNVAVTPAGSALHFHFTSEQFDRIKLH